MRCCANIEWRKGLRFEDFNDARCHRNTTDEFCWQHIGYRRYDDVWVKESFRLQKEILNSPNVWVDMVTAKTFPSVKFIR